MHYKKYEGIVGNMKYIVYSASILKEAYNFIMHFI